MTHYRKPDLCRVLAALQSAQNRALGKDDVCQVLAKKHSANTASTWQTPRILCFHCLPSADMAKKRYLAYPIFAECPRACTRQRRRMCQPCAPTVHRSSSGLTHTCCQAALRSLDFGESLLLALDKVSFA